MWDKALDAAISQQQSFIAVLFVVLLATTAALVKWQLNVNDAREKRIEQISLARENKMGTINESRENRYIDVIASQTEVIEKQANALGCLDAMKDDLKDMKTYIITHNKSANSSQQ